MKQFFVPYPIAKALKEIGFVEETLAWYRDPNNYDIQFLGHVEGELMISKVEKAFVIAKGIRAPLYDQVIQWFIDKHQVLVDVWTMEKTWSFELSDISDEGYTRKDGTKRYSPRRFGADSKEYPIRKEALDAGIEKAISLIKKKL